MGEFLNLLPPRRALEKLLERFSPQVVSEVILTENALGRVVVSPVRAPFDLPPFNRTTVDGYAVRAADTFGASEGLPAYLTVVGEIPMGATPDVRIDPGECTLIHTGGMLPEGGDAVVMVEHTQSTRPGEIEVLRAAAIGENVLRAGEDVKRGQEVIAAGTRLRPSEIGGLMALGITEALVARRPRVGVISTGDEVVSPHATLQAGQVYDVNTYSLSALVIQAGGEPVSYGIVPDQESILLRTARGALTDCDLVVLTAGSSVSARDLTSRVIDSLGQPGVLVHGVNVQPGKPTILALCDGKVVIGLPGNPVSALVIASLFVVPVVEALQGLRIDRPRLMQIARLATNLPSQAGREDWVPVRLVPDQGGFLAEPVFGKSNLIFTLARADGLVRIPPEANGLAVGELVEVLVLY